MTKVPQESSKKQRTSMMASPGKHAHTVPGDNEDLMILAECALSVNSPSTFMAVPSSPSSLSSPNSYPPSSPMAYPPSPSAEYLYDTPQVEFTKDFIVQLQSCIERCLQEHLTMEEACSTIYYHYAIDPRVTEIVWRKLEAENPAYFKEYITRVMQHRAQHSIHPSIF